MILVAKTYWAGMPFWFRRPPENASVLSLALRTDDSRQLRANYWSPTGTTPRVGVVVIHPRVEFTHHYTVPRLVAAGFGVLAANSRHVNNDTSCEHEELVLDVAACVKWLRRKAGVERVVLLGNCGGGSLVAYYQAQAALPPERRLERSPGGTPTRFASAEMTPADALVLVAAHRGQGHVLLRSIDAAVVDEADPFRSDPALDVYDPRNGFREPPEPSSYAPAFVARVREAQQVRVQRIDDRARALLAEHGAAVTESEAEGFAQCPFAERLAVLRRRAHEPVMTVQRTMANPAFTDPALDRDPGDAPREYGSLLSDRPDLMNLAATGFARTCTPRAWLSTWSALSSHADPRRERRARGGSDARRARGARSRGVLRPGHRAGLRGQRRRRQAARPHRGGASLLRAGLRREAGARRRPHDGRRRALDEGATRAMTRHPTTATWLLPPGGRAQPAGARRTNLRVLAARPERFEHHLTVVARAGGAQLEIATASEPLYFAHVNVSDEYALALPTGDPAIDGFPMRTFLADAGTLEDVARYNHRVGDLVLHPLGALHWPGRLRPPFEPFVPPKGARRCGVSLVFCAPAPSPALQTSPSVSEGRDADAKPYVAAPPPLVLRDLLRDPPGSVARVADAVLELVDGGGEVRASRGAYVVVLDAVDGGPHWACDLVHVPPGGAFDATGVRRALVLRSDGHDVEPPPPSWDSLPAPPFPVLEDAPRGALPVVHERLTVTELDAGRVSVAVGEGRAIVPRYWLARMLFRVALHRPLLGYVETYGGFYFDDRDPAAHRIGVRGAGAIVLPPADSLRLVERLYRAVAPDGYSERLDA